MKLSRPGTSPTSRLWHAPTWLLNHLAGTGRRLLQQNLGDAFERNKFAVLAVLGDNGPLDQINVSRRSGQDRGDLVALLDRLADEGLVERVPDPDDRRRNVVHLTKSGARELARLDLRVSDAQEKLLAPLDENDRRELVGIIQTLLEHHEDFRT